MYKLSHFSETDFKEIYSFIQEHPFVTLIGSHDGTTSCSQIPVLIAVTNDTIVLRGHFMRHTDHHKVFAANQNALVLFTGPQCYVSAGWYDERGHGSTWNYMTVQGKGIMQFYEEPETIQLLKDLTHHFEDHKPRPELLENMSDEYVYANVKAIIGFELTLTDIHATFKLSQNRNDESYKTIVAELEAIGNYNELKIAAEMKKRRPRLFL